MHMEHQQIHFLLEIEKHIKKHGIKRKNHIYYTDIKLLIQNIVDKSEKITYIVCNQCGEVAYNAYSI